MYVTTGDVITIKGLIPEENGFFFSQKPMISSSSRVGPCDNKNQGEINELETVRTIG